MFKSRFFAVLICLAAASAFAADDVRLFCLPVQNYALRLGASFKSTDIPVHCLIDVAVQERGVRRCLRTEADDRYTYILDIPCSKMVSAESEKVESEGLALEVLHYEAMTNCNATKLLKAAFDYGDDSLRPGMLTEENDVSGGYKTPQRYGVPAYLPATSNTFIRWTLEQCGSIVKRPKGAIGWDVKPSFYGPRR
jgi:hypothetical protein